MKRMSSLFMVVVSVGAALAVACSSPTPQSGAGGAGAATAGGSAAASDADKQWTMPNKNLSATRHSGLTEINTGNVQNLKAAWSFSTGVLRGHEGEPLVVGSTMYLVTPFPRSSTRWI